MSRRRKPDPTPHRVEVVDLSHDGRGIARLDGKTVFVPDALPGETVELRLTRRKRSYDEAELLDVITPNPHRIEPRCAHFGVCGGCSLQHYEESQQLAAKQKHLAEQFQRIGELSPAHWLQPLTGPVWGYRRRARLAVKWVIKKERVLVGFRERGKPYVADMQECHVLDERVGSKLRELAALIEGLSVRDQLPQIEVAAGDEDVALVFRHLQPLSEADKDKLIAFGREHGFAIYGQSGGLDTITPLERPAALSYALPEYQVEFDFTPIDFVQVNAALNRSMVTLALQQLQLEPGDTVLELFAGLGNFTLPMARSGAHVAAVEGDEGLVSRGRANAESHGLTIDYHVADLFETVGDESWLSVGYNKLFLDPPRAGADHVLPFALKNRPQRIVYVSCHPATLARDARIIVDAGYVLESAGVMDMFPHTGHVESIATFVAA